MDYKYISKYQQFSNDELKELENTIINNHPDDIDNIISTQISGKYIWRYLLYVLTLLVILEMYISNIYVYKNK